MKPPIFPLVLATALIPLTGCKSKADAKKIKELEAEQVVLNETIETLRMEHEAEIDAKAEEISSIEADFEKEIVQLRKERDDAVALSQQVSDSLKRMESRIATLPRAAQATVTESAPPPEEGLNPEKQQSVVLIEGDSSKGTGFIVGIGDKRYLYTAAHVLSGNQKLTVTSAAGRKFARFGPLEAAEGADLVRLEVLDAEDAPFLTLAKPTDAIASGTKIVALGNGGGAGVIATEKGTILGQSGESLEVSAAVIQGNSGGPVLDSVEGTVLGVVTHLTSERKDLWSDGTRFGEVRRFACRLNRDWEWKSVPIGSFLAEAKLVAEYDRHSRVGYAISMLSPTTEGLRISGTLPGGQDALAILSDAKDLPFVAEIIEMNVELGAKRMRSSEADLRRRFRSMIDATASAVKRNGNGFDPSRLTWFHRQQAAHSAEWRKTTEDALRQSLDSLAP
jgi:S1-C subfamily serine protease